MKATSLILLSLLWAAGQPGLAATVLSEPELVELCSSPVWQVRYCVAREFGSPTATARKCLERLATDAHPVVARHSFAVYSGLFVALDRAVVNKAIERNDFSLQGGRVADPKAFATPDFWVNRLAALSDDASRGAAVRVLGLVGSASHTNVLSQYETSANSYLLLELALAYYRLGNRDAYQRVLDRILGLPTNTSIYYQTRAIDCLLQTDPAKAREAYGALNKRVQEFPDLQPGWMYAHVLQGRRVVPRATGQSGIAGNSLSEQDLVELSASPIWQVRCSVALEFDSPTATARKCLERLATDAHLGGGKESFDVYSELFVALDQAAVNKAVERNDFFLVGYDFADPKVFSTPDFWVSRLADVPDDSLRGAAVRVLGLLGNASHTNVLSQYESSTNAYLLLELALAYYRLGGRDAYQRVLDKILGLPTNTNICYQTRAIDYLLQTDPAKARKAYRKLNKRVQKFPDLQPGWMYAHVLQGRRLQD